MFADRGSPTTLRAAIRDLMAEFGPRYPSGDEFLRRLAAMEKQMSAGTDRLWNSAGLSKTAFNAQIGQPSP